MLPLTLATRRNLAVIVEFESTKTPVTGECDRPLRDITDEIGSAPPIRTETLLINSEVSCQLDQSEVDMVD